MDGIKQNNPPEQGNPDPETQIEYMFTSRHILGGKSVINNLKFIETQRLDMGTD